MYILKYYKYIFLIVKYNLNYLNPFLNNTNSFYTFCNLTFKKKSCYFTFQPGLRVIREGRTFRFYFLYLTNQVENMRNRID